MPLEKNIIFRYISCDAFDDIRIGVSDKNGQYSPYKTYAICNISTYTIIIYVNKCCHLLFQHMHNAHIKAMVVSI